MATSILTRKLDEEIEFGVLEGSMQRIPSLAAMYKQHVVAPNNQPPNSNIAAAINHYSYSYSWGVLILLL